MNNDNILYMLVKNYSWFFTDESKQIEIYFSPLCIEFNNFRDDLDIKEIELDFGKTSYYYDQKHFGDIIEVIGEKYGFTGTQMFVIYNLLMTYVDCLYGEHNFTFEHFMNKVGKNDCEKVNIKYGKANL